MRAEKSDPLESEKHVAASSRNSRTAKEAAKHGSKHSTIIRESRRVPSGWEARSSIRVYAGRNSPDVSFIRRVPGSPFVWARAEENPGGRWQWTVWVDDATLDAGDEVDLETACAAADHVISARMV